MFEKNILPKVTQYTKLDNNADVSNYATRFMIYSEFFPPNCSLDTLV